MNFSHHRAVSESALEYGRGIAGGLIFSLPLIYTMEVWWAGFVLNPSRILLYVISTFGLLLLYNRFAGLRRDASMVEVAIDSVEEMGIGLILAALILWLTGQIDLQTEILEMTGKVVMEAMTVAIGVSVGSSQLGGDDGGDEGVSGHDEKEESKYVPQAAIALCGAILFAANIAPTEEVAIIAMESPPWKILLLALGSVLAAAAVLHYSGMYGAERHVAKDTLFLKVRGLLTTYAVALAGAAACLHFFGGFDGQPLGIALSMCVVAGVPATLGASAGRLLIQTSSPQ
ncbi:MAG TPA: TIGR02587 family membrane protein [Verrucomicrobiales bacterium]|nr:TIGR02587 family membrane protein [Verrucomicrobiales bacterium]